MNVDALPSRFFIGSYPAAPSWHHPWDAAAEAQFCDALEAIPNIAGLELPFVGRLHRHDEAWLLRRLPRTWRFVVTCIPGTMERMALQPDFGLASSVDEGRRAAVRFIGEAAAAVRRLHDAFGQAVVDAVVVHSAPRHAAGMAPPSAAAFSRSLTELAKLDLGGAAIWVEHCDAHTLQHKPAKGFLSLDAELTALHEARDPHGKWGMLINWGRSALETRDPEEPLRHLRAVRDAGLLRGLIFSACTIGDPDYGSWEDSHAPFCTSASGGGGRATSLLTEERVAACLAMAAVPTLACLGVKIQALPLELAPRARAQVLADARDALQRAVSKRSGR